MYQSCEIKFVSRVIKKNTWICGACCFRIPGGIKNKWHFLFYPISRHSLVLKQFA